MKARLAAVLILALSAAGQDRFFSGRPFSIDDLITAMPIPAPRLVRAIEGRGIAFRADDEVVSRLKAAGASKAVIDAVQRAAVHVEAPKPVVPVKPEVGTVAVTCAPAECDVRVNGFSRGQTSGGKADVAGVRAGSVVVDFQKAGYIGTQVTVTVAADRTVTASAVLEPDLATKQLFGEQLFARVEQALGGDAMKNAMSFETSGTASVLMSGGVRREWKLNERAALPAQTAFRFTDGRLQHELSILLQRSLTNNKLRGPEAEWIEKLMRLTLDHYPPAFFAKLRASQPKFIASRTGPAEGQDYFLTAETPEATYTISLDVESRPQVIRVTSPHVDRNGLQWTYGNYAATAGVQLPKSYSVTLPGMEQPSLELRLEGYEFGAYKDADFKLGRRLFRK